MIACLCRGECQLLFPVHPRAAWGTAGASRPGEGAEVSFEAAEGGAAGGGPTSFEAGSVVLLPECGCEAAVWLPGAFCKRHWPRVYLASGAQV